MSPAVIRLLTRLQMPLFWLLRGRWQYVPTLKLWTVGRVSGRERAVLLVYLEDGARVVVVGSYGGHSADPHWRRNLLAEPRCRVWSAARGAEELVASELTGEERAAVWERLVALYPPYAGYQAKTERLIPVIALSPPDAEAATGAAGAEEAE